jgi:hypothetical protein
MLTHKTFTAQTIGLTGKSSLTQRERVRDQAEAFMNHEIKADQVFSITESAMSIGGQIAVTVWYRQD